MTEKKADPSVEDQLKALQGQMQQLQQANETLQRTNMQLMSVAPQQASPQQHNTTTQDVQNLQPDLSNLPDPVTNPKEYAQELMRRTQQTLRTQQEAFRHQQDQQRDAQTRSVGMWNDFQSRFPQFKDKDKQLGFVVQQVAQRAEALGVDPDRYMYGPGREQFYQDVIREYESTFGPAAGAEDKAKAQDQDQQQQQQQQTDDGRTAVFGGNDGSVRTAPDDKDPNDKPIPFHEQMIAAQKPLGYVS